MTPCHHRDDPDPQGRPALALEAEALFVVGVLRAWTATQRPGGAGDAPDWQRIFVMAELPSEAAAAFGSLMAIVRHAMRRPLDVRCCPCPQVGQDEEAMLRLLGALQREDRLGALDELSDWLVPEATMPALRAAGTFAAMLGDHDVWLTSSAIPARGWPRQETFSRCGISADRGGACTPGRA